MTAEPPREPARHPAWPNRWNARVQRRERLVADPGKESGCSHLKNP